MDRGDERPEWSVVWLVVPPLPFCLRLVGITPTIAIAIAIVAFAFDFAPDSMRTTGSKLLLAGVMFSLFFVRLKN